MSRNIAGEQNAMTDGWERYRRALFLIFNYFFLFYGIPENKLMKQPLCKPFTVSVCLSDFYV